MILIFFQNCLSPHQIPYIRECAKDERVDDVYFVMPRVDLYERSDMGWSSDGLLKGTTIKFMLRPTDEEVGKLLCDKGEDVRCLFSGIRGDADVFGWLKISLGYNVKRYIITEPPFTFDKPLWMHYIRFYLQDYKYVKHIDGVFAIGESCEKYYHSISKKWRVFPFMYVTEGCSLKPLSLHDEMKLLYVGSLSKRKNVKVLIDSMKGIPNVKLNIVGDGEERQELERLVDENKVNAVFHGTKSMADIPVEMQRNDVLVLPSLYDGWGAVVNEALTQGMFVICSDKCGAKDLLHDQRRGAVFCSNNVDSLKNKIQQSINSIQVIRSNRLERIKWVEQSISGKVIAKYMIDNLVGNIVDCPWK